MGWPANWSARIFWTVWELVEPREDDGAGLAVVEAAVELLADGVGEAGNFADEGTLVIHKLVESWVS